MLDTAQIEEPWRSVLPGSLGSTRSPDAFTLRFAHHRSTLSGQRESPRARFMHSTAFLDLNAPLLQRCERLKVIKKRPLKGITVPAWLCPREFTVQWLCSNGPGDMGADFQLQFGNLKAFVSRLEKREVGSSVDGEGDLGKCPAWCKQLVNAAKAAQASISLI